MADTVYRSADPRVVALQSYFADERGAGRMIFGFEDREIAAMLAVADRAIEQERIRQITHEVANG